MSDVVVIALTAEGIPAALRTAVRTCRTAYLRRCRYPHAQFGSDVHADLKLIAAFFEIE
jgi:hypothetical protein